MRMEKIQTGEQIDRRDPVSFRFDGRQIDGFRGDTIASALLAAGVRIVGRSFRLHRPRGIFSSGIEEPSALVHVKIGAYEEPNVRATLCPIQPDLEVFSQNCWPSLKWDWASVFDWFPRIWSAGFYHKTFMWPRWHTYEPFIRAVAGIGRVRSPNAQVGICAQRDLEVDVLVCGGGVGGFAAAREAARAGASVTLIDSGMDDNEDRRQQTHSSIEVLRKTEAVGVFGEKVVVAIQHLGWSPQGPRRCLVRIRAKAIIVATGAIEQPMVFEHNDRPGVMLAGAITEYLRKFAVKAGQRVVLVTNNDAAYDNLECWREAGISVAAIVDSRPRPGKFAQSSASACHAPLINAPLGLRVLGRSRVIGVRIREASGSHRHLDCDLVAMSGGYIPNAHLYSQAQGHLTYSSSVHGYVPLPDSAGIYAVGSAAGHVDPEVILAQSVAVGEAAGRFALGESSNVRTSGNGPLLQRPSVSIGPTRIAGRTHRQWLDFQHDVTVADADSAVEQGYTHVEHFKRYTTTGMAVDQGKTSVRNALEHLARKTGQTLADLRPPTHRPPFVPLPMALAAGPNVGRWYRPERRLPAHAEHVALGAHFDDVGGWQRPLYYGCAHVPGQPMEAEILAVRSGAGLFDGSPLGKLEVSGPDAREFLDRLYVNSLRSLSVGRVRYVLMLRDNGVVLDDGTVTCLGPEEFLVTTTSGNAERIHLWMREWAECEWPDLKVLITPVTTAWGTVTLSGPRARSILARVCSDVDLGKDAFPHMTFRTGRVADIPARIHRVSFTGEVSYEINVHAEQTVNLWRALLSEGKAEGLCPYGIDALNALRTEKGYLHIGADTDTTTTPIDLGWQSIIQRKAGDFVGRRALSLPEYLRADRLQLVGIVSADPAAPLLSGAHLIRPDSRRSEGYLTSTHFSRTLGHAVALARLENGRARLGEELLAYDQGATKPVKVVKPVFYDVEGLRLQA